jgi:hypothetical protein
MLIVPLQSQCDSFYGNPRGANGQVNPQWVRNNLVTIKPPFQMRYAGKKISSITVHKKCASSLLAALTNSWIASGKDQKKVDDWGLSTFGGSFNYRIMRNSNHLSMHAYGCAIDFAPERFPMGKTNAKFVPEVIKAFSDQGAINLAHDRMHFQFAKIG